MKPVRVLNGLLRAIARSIPVGLRVPPDSNDSHQQGRNPCWQENGSRREKFPRRLPDAVQAEILPGATTQGSRTVVRPDRYLVLING